MLRRALRCVVLAMLLVPTAMLATACSKDSSAGTSTNAPASVLGTYESAAEKMTLELKSGGKATITDEGKPTEHNWEMDGASKVVVHGADGVNLLFTVNSDGNLSDGMGTIFKKK
jgi:hypothetical protein